MLFLWRTVKTLVAFLRKTISTKFIETKPPVHLIDSVYLIGYVGKLVHLLDQEMRDKETPNSEFLSKLANKYHYKHFFSRKILLPYTM